MVRKPHELRQGAFHHLHAILDACADNASVEEMAALILGIDPVLEPDRARKVFRSYLDRANWMVTTGYKEIFAG